MKAVIFGHLDVDRMILSAYGVHTKVALKKGDTMTKDIIIHNGKDIPTDAMLGVVGHIVDGILVMERITYVDR